MERGDDAPFFCPFPHHGFLNMFIFLYPKPFCIKFRAVFTVQKMIIPVLTGYCVFP